MIIQWFPGHMHKAQKEMRKLLPRIDVVIEVLDARVPFSSRNPLIETIRQQTPHIKLLNNCLLYTSPSPRDKRQSRMPSSA